MQSNYYKYKKHRYNRQKLTELVGGLSLNAIVNYSLEI